KSVVGGRIGPEGQDVGIRRRGVLEAERLDAGLQEFPASVRAMPEYRTEIAKAARLAGGGGGEIVARDRDGEVGTQAELAPLRVARQIHALADVLAGEGEERLRRLQNRRCPARIARAFERGDERVGARLGRDARWDDACTRHGGRSRFSLWRRRFSTLGR